MKKNLLFTILILAFNFSYSQVLKPGFDKEEYSEMLSIFATHYDRVSADGHQISPPKDYFFDYCSYEICLENKWDLWIKNDTNVAVISIRGTTQNAPSWLENFYSAMIPAKGEIKVSEDYIFNYHLADNPEAKVHVGWLLATAFLVREMEQRIDSCYKLGIKDFIIMGHSQGGAIAYLTTAHLLRKQKEGVIEKDIRFKTYCSAAPKPGNLYFAYDYEYATQGGWAYNVVNTADWVPETPFSVQTIYDFNPINPFTDAKVTIKKQKLKTRIAMNFAYNKMVKPPIKSQKQYERFLGSTISKYVQKNIKGYEPIPYEPSANFTRAGNYIVLKADEDYYDKYPNDKEKMFQHHFLAPYLYLLNKL